MPAPCQEIRVRILILGINYAPEQIGIGPYTAGLAEALSDAGHDVRVIAGKPYYPAWRVMAPYSRPGYHRQKIGKIPVTYCPHYVPHHPNGVRRIFHHMSFAITAAFPALRAARLFRPHLVLCVAPSLVSAPLARMVARIAKSHCWLHIQDFEVEAAFATALIDRESKIGRAAIRFQDFAIRGFDMYTTISPQMCDKLLTLGLPQSRVVELRNWADTEGVKPLEKPSRFRRDWGIDAPYVALYSGNIANKQGIEVIVQAAQLLVHRSDIMFVICGNGPQKEHLMSSASAMSNICFHDLQPADQLGEMLGLASVHLLPQLGQAADLLLPSKLTNMLASGRPIVATAEKGTALANEVEGCGLVIPPGDGQALAEAIEQLADNASLRQALGQAGRARAEERWSKRNILGRFIRTILRRFELERMEPANGGVV